MSINIKVRRAELANQVQQGRAQIFALRNQLKSIKAQIRVVEDQVQATLGGVAVLDELLEPSTPPLSQLTDEEAQASAV